MTRSPSAAKWRALVVALALPMAALSVWGQSPNPLVPLTRTPGEVAQKELIELGRLLFADGRLSGDATTSCASCHDPNKAFTDGLPLSKGYPGTLYFRNTPSLFNVAGKSFLYWDGRMTGRDLPSLIRDHIAEAHFMQADGRLVIERLRQIPEYEQRFRSAYGGEPTYGRILKSVAAFVASLQSTAAPIDRYLAGDLSAMPQSAVRGMELFVGKANCIACHQGATLEDDALHVTGVPDNPEVFSAPERHITFRRFMRTIGMGPCASLRQDIGYQCVSKLRSDAGRFRTPSLREVGRTAPYMHNGVLETLRDVVEFYDRGGGELENKDERLKPLGLSDAEKADLVEFLNQLQSEASRPRTTSPVTLPSYELRHLGEAGELAG